MLEDPCKEEAEKWTERSCSGELTAVLGTAHQSPSSHWARLKGKKKPEWKDTQKEAGERWKLKMRLTQTSHRQRAFLRLERDNDST